VWARELIVSFEQGHATQMFARTHDGTRLAWITDVLRHTAAGP
jgi:hypothetical protein